MRAAVEEDLASRIRVVPHSRDYFNRSWDWVNDPEIKPLKTPDCGREEQLALL